MCRRTSLRTLDLRAFFCQRGVFGPPLLLLLLPLILLMSLMLVLLVMYLLLLLLFLLLLLLLVELQVFEYAGAAFGH